MIIFTVGLSPFNIIVEGEWVGGFGGGVGYLCESTPARPHLSIWLMRKVSYRTRGLLIWYDIWYDIWYVIWYMICDMIYDMWYDMIYDMVYDMIYDMIWYDMIYDMIWYDMIWYDICYDTIRYDTIWYTVWYIWYDIFNCNWVATRWQ